MSHFLIEALIVCLIIGAEINDDQKSGEISNYNNSDNGDVNNLSTNEDKDVSLVWLSDAIKDVAYYLRAHKFNEYDRRYEKPDNISTKSKYFAAFPKPPLRSLHWDVQAHCSLSFIHCMDYLSKRIKETALKRKDDTVTVMQDQHWSLRDNAEQVKVVEEECKRMRKEDDIFAYPFEGPLERFRWRTTASYFMCWYALNEIPELKHFNEPCDNFAQCLDTLFGSNNKDVRAGDNEEFHCILYSVCPDPCCPIRHISNLEDCWTNELNPCFLHNSSELFHCLFEYTINTDFNSLILNQWNVTCNCTEPGYKWISRYGLCVDVNECAIGAYKCNQISESCFNINGSYKCICRWGYTWDDLRQTCVVNSKSYNLAQQNNALQDKNQTKISIAELLQNLINYIKLKTSSNSPSTLFIFKPFVIVSFIIIKLY